MSHYSQFRQGACLVPVGNTADLFNAEPTNTIDDALGFCAGMKHIVEDKTQEQPVRKHSKGKAEGARYCFLSSIAAASEYATGAADYVARQLDNLNLDQAPCEQQLTFMMIVEYAALAVGGHKELWNGVIAVRRKALESGKYTPQSYKEPIEPELLLDAAARHMIAYLYVDEIDEESNENHMCHIVANVLMIAEQLRSK